MLPFVLGDIGVDFANSLGTQHALGKAWGGIEESEKTARGRRRSQSPRRQLQEFLT